MLASYFIDNCAVDSVDLKEPTADAFKDELQKLNPIPDKTIGLYLLDKQEPFQSEAPENMACFILLEDYSSVMAGVLFTEDGYVVMLIPSTGPESSDEFNDLHKNLTSSSSYFTPITGALQ